VPALTRKRLVLIIDSYVGIPNGGVREMPAGVTGIGGPQPFRQSKRHRARLRGRPSQDPIHAEDAKKSTHDAGARTATTTKRTATIPAVAAPITAIPRR